MSMSLTLCNPILFIYDIFMKNVAWYHLCNIELDHCDLMISHRLTM